MTLIDKYIEQVGENLPSKDREDIQKEIRSILEDTLENRGLQDGKPVDEAMTVDVLKEFGTPKKVAASYLPPRYLIGPRLYPTFMMIAKIALGIVALVGIVTTSVALFQQPYSIDSSIEFVLKKLLEVIGSMLSVLGNVVFVFAIVEWALSKEKTPDEETWDPRSLEGEVDRNTVKPWSQVPDITLTVIALLVFNVFASKFGGYINDPSGIAVFIPALSPTFFSYLPWINAVWLLGLGLNFALIRIGKWQTWSRWFQILLDVASLVILIVMVAGPSIIVEAGESFAAAGITASQIAGIYTGLGIGMKALLIILTVISIIDIVENFVRLIRKK